jgi:lipopolysaccharide heptosyltransferase II
MKILIIRLSSIGDIVLTTPIVRCVKQQIPNAEIHYLCKPEYKNILETNPYIDKIHLFDKKWIADFCRDGARPVPTKTEKFDYIIDLQNNYRSRKLCRKLKIPHAHFPKLNVKKWLLVNFKINKLPNIHVVDRYFTATKVLPFPIKKDNQGLDFFIDKQDTEAFDSYAVKKPFISIAIGSQHFTKQIPIEKLIAICKNIDDRIVLLGGKEDFPLGEILCKSLSDKAIHNLCGSLTLRQSAAFVAQSKALLTGDTGLMHIAAARNKPIVSVWGNTVPAFGMYPYMPQHPDRYHIIENKNLRCRPCSKLGFEKCPKKHFKCMKEIDVEGIVKILNTLIRSEQNRIISQTNTPKSSA